MSSIHFPSHSEKINATPIKPPLISWCPSMDLLAFVSDSNEVVLNRLSGQRVWLATIGAYRASPENITAISWRPDGKVLAVGFHNGDLQYLDVDDGKVIDTLHTHEHTAIRTITAMSWTDGKRVESKSKTELTWDVRTQLPFLSPLPTSSTERVYTTTHAVHTLIHDLEKEDARVRFLSVCSDPYQFRLLVGSFHLDLSGDGINNQSASILNHNTSSDLTDHVVITKCEDVIRAELYEMAIFRSVDPTIRDMTNTFNDYYAVNSYLVESIDVLVEEHTIIIDTRLAGLSRLQKLLNPRQGSARDELFALLMSGVPSSELESWLEEEVSERVVQRWSKTCRSCFDNMREIVIDSSLPACDRLIIMLMKLRSMATDPVKQVQTGLVVEHLDACISSITLLIAQLHSLLRAMTTEVDLFSSFCEWMVFLIARLSPDDETPDAAPPFEYRKVAKYIRQEFPNGLADHFFGEKKIDIEQYLDKDIGTLDPFPQLDVPGSPTLRHTIAYFAQATQSLIEQPARFLAKHWKPKHARHLLKASQATVQSIFIDKTSPPCLYVVLSQDTRDMTNLDQSHEACIYVLKKVITGQETDYEVCRVGFEGSNFSGSQVKDLKILDDTEVLVLLQGIAADKPSHLVAFAYRILPFTPVDKAAAFICSTSVLHTSVEANKYRELPIGVQPVALAVNGTRGRRTGMYLQSDRQRYTVFDLDDEAEDRMEDSSDESDCLEEEMEEE